MSVFIDNFVKGFLLAEKFQESRAVKAIAEVLARVESGEDPAAVIPTLRNVFARGASGSTEAVPGSEPLEPRLSSSSYPPAVRADRSSGRAAATSAGGYTGIPTGGPDDADFLVYGNQDAQRNLPISDRLKAAFAQFAPDMGLKVEVVSGGQGSGSRGIVGTTRHNDGEAADVRFYRDGRMLDWASDGDRPVFQEIIRRARKAGITGIGVGPGYMGPGMMHLGFGPVALWGAGGRSANAPDWARDPFFNYGG